MPKKKGVKKSKKQLAIRPVLLFLIVALLFLTFSIVYKKSTLLPPTTQTEQVMFDFGNQTYKLDGQQISLTNGSYQASDPMTGEHTATIVNQAINPSQTRAAAIMVDSPGGSGTFFYLVGATVMENRIVYSEPILLGDRIKVISLKVDDPQTYDNGMIMVELLNRPVNAPMSTEPTEKITSKYAFQNNGNLLVVLE